MSLETSELCRPKTSLIGKTDKPTCGQLLPLVCLQSMQPILHCVRVKGQLFYFLNIYCLFNLNPSDYELQTKETGVSADQ